MDLQIDDNSMYVITKTTVHRHSILFNGEVVTTHVTIHVSKHDDNDDSDNERRDRGEPRTAVRMRLK